jgi:hypothetical protein
MQYRCWVLVVLGLLSQGQTGYAQTVNAGGAAPTNTAAASASPSSGAPDEPVITIDGICISAPWSIAQHAATASPSGTGNSGTAGSSVGHSAADLDRCKLVITRVEFEKLALVVTPNTPPQSDLPLARVYSNLLVSALKGHELGLDRDPHFDDILNFTYVQVLARAMNNHLQQQADEQTNAEFEKYYKEHPQEFEQVQLLQISIPKRKLHANESGPASAGKADAATEEAAMKAEAEKIYRRAVAGEDFEKLQEEAYTVAGNPDAAPDADMGQVTRAEVGQFQELVFALPPGQVSEIMPVPEAWHIVEVVSRRMMPREEAKKRISARRMKEAVDSLNNSAQPQFNDAYFRNPDEIPTKSSPEGPK